MMNNKQAGNKFEKDFCVQLAEDGFWVHFFLGTKQPADIIAVRNENAYLIDAKDCENDRFVFSRIENNQDSAMRFWELCGNNQGLFALKTSEGVYMLPYGRIQTLEALGYKSLNMMQIKANSTPYDKWKEVA